MFYKNHDPIKNGLTDAEYTIRLPMRPGELIILLVCLMLNVPVNYFSVMLGRSHRFLGITSTFGGVNMSCYNYSVKSFSDLELQTDGDLAQ